MSFITATRGTLLAATLVALSAAAAPAFADPADFFGDWKNVDPDTNGLTHVIVMPTPFGPKVRAFGACHPSDCDWGTVHGQFFGGDTLAANFHSGFSLSHLTLHLGWHHKLDFQLHTHFTDGSGRPDYDLSGALRMPGGFGGGGFGGGFGGGGPSLGAEDCIGFDPAAVSASYVGGDWKVVQGAMWMLDYGSDAAAAHHAAFVIKHYHFDQQCFVRRPNAAMMYWKSGNTVPSGNTAGQDCIGLDPAMAHAQYTGGAWKVVDNGNWLLDYGADHAAAEHAAAVIRIYNLNRQCFIERPNASMQYWLAQ
ncbi:MAG TPA: hypothetical protein VNU97_06480 [Rhizomicrobium sp.]|jgi:hypothetical protein|nr:hypothetical protein [Rhizomicrobium sp.]